MKIINPTDKDVATVINGVSYVVAAEGELDNVNPVAAKAWKKVHGFLTLEDDEAIFAAPMVPEEKTEDDEEEDETTKEDDEEVN